MDWAEFVLALAAFLGSHVIPARLKAPLVACVGRRAYVIGYSLLSLALFYWLIVAAGRAPWVGIWPQSGWMRWLVNLAMPAAAGLALLGGMGGLMAGFVLWGGAHLLANGDLAHVILFGLLLGYALFGLKMTAFRWRLSWSRLLAVPVVWAVLFCLHPLVIGVSPLP